MQTHQVSKTHYKVCDFVTWAKAGTLILSPSFQRRSVWPTGAKSFLLDTIVRGLPIPIIFLREQKTDLDSLEPKREVVDGQQRIRTVLAFLAPRLVGEGETDLFVTTGTFVLAGFSRNSPRTIEIPEYTKGAPEPVFVLE
jgi:hypothetical protein